MTLDIGQRPHPAFLNGKRLILTNQIERRLVVTLGVGQRPHPAFLSGKRLILTNQIERRLVVTLDVGQRPHLTFLHGLAQRHYRRRRSRPGSTGVLRAI